MAKKTWIRRALGMVLSASMLISAGGNLVFAADYPEVTITASDESITVQDGEVTLSAEVTNVTDDSVVWSSDNNNAVLVDNGDNTATLTGKINGSITVTATSVEDELSQDSIEINISGQPDRGVDYGLKIYFIGNSIAKHGPNPSIGWTGNWGMAASSEDKDYIHRLVNNYIGPKYGVPEFMISSKTSLLETTMVAEDNYDYTQTHLELIKEIDAYAPDIINVQVGENTAAAPTAAHREAAFSQFIEKVRVNNPDAVINICNGFWGNANDIEAKAAVAAKFDNVYVSATNIGDKDENKAIGLFEHGGVAAHPGDTGMDNMAKIMFETLDPVISKKFDASYVTYPSEITIEGANTISTEKGETALTAKVSPADAVAEVEWSVDDENLATVNDDGVVTAKNNGTVTVTAKSKYNDAKAEAVIEITGQSAPHTLTYAPGTTETVTNLPEVNEYAKGNVTFSDVIPEREGYIFVGWSLSEGGKVIESADITSDTTVYAIWKLATLWEFEENGRFDGMSVINAFNVYVISGNLMAISTGMTEDALLTVVSPTLKIPASDYNRLGFILRNSAVSDTELTVEITSDAGVKTYTKAVPDTNRNEYIFDISDATGTITGFKIIPTNIDCTINIDKIYFGYEETEEGYYSNDLFDGRLYDCDNASYYGFSATVDNEVYHHGGSSIRFNPTGWDEDWMNPVIVSAADYPIKNGDKVNLSLWIKKSADAILIDSPIDQITMQYKINYIDAVGTEYKTESHLIRDSHYLLEDTTDWQYLEEEFEIKDINITDECKIVSVEFSARFRQSQAGAFKGNVWVDQISLRRALPGGARLSNDATFEGTNLPAISGYLAYDNGGLSTTVGHNDNTSFHYSGTGYKLFGIEFYNLTLDTNEPEFNTSFWLKKDAGTPNTLRLWHDVYYYGTDGQEYKASVDDIINIEDTTDWQFVSFNKKVLLEKMAPSGGKVRVFVPMMRPGDGFTNTNLGELNIWIDELAISNVISDELVKTKLISMDAEANKATLVFNLPLINKTTLENAVYYVNGEKAAADVNILADSKTVELTFEDVVRIKSLEFEGLKNIWGQNIVTDGVRDSINPDDFFNNVFGNTYTNADGNIGADYKWEVDTEEAYSGSTSVKLLPSRSVMLFSYTIPTNKVNSGDTFDLSFKIKKGQNLMFGGDDGSTAQKVSGFRVIVDAAYIDSQGEQGYTEIRDYYEGLQDVFEDNTEWQEGKVRISLPDDVYSKFPADAQEIQGVRIHVRPNLGGWLSITDNIWLDEIMCERVFDTSYSQNMIPAEFYECDESFSNGGDGYKSHTVDTEIWHEGGKSQKITGTGYDMANIIGYTIENVTYGQDYNLSFWYKKSENNTDSAVTVMFRMWYPKADGTEAMAGPTITIPVKDTTDWQRVSTKISPDYAGIKEGKVTARAMQILIRRENGWATDLGDAAIWLDQFELYKLPEDTIITSVDEMLQIASGNKVSGIRVKFNSDFVNKSNVQGASIYLDNESVPFTVEMNEEENTANITFSEAKSFESFKMVNLTDIWGTPVAVPTSFDNELAAVEEVNAQVSFEYHLGGDPETEWTTATKADLVDFGDFIDKFRVSVALENLTSGDETADAIVVRKDADILKSVKIFEASALSGDTNTTSCEFVNDVAKDTEIMVYVWNSAEEMEPVCVQVGLN